MILPRFAFRQVWFDSKMARSFYQLPEKEIKQAAKELVQEGVFVENDGGWMRREDEQILQQTESTCGLQFVYAIHRNDFLYKSQEHLLKPEIQERIKDCQGPHEILQYLLIDGEFGGACIGKFRNGPYDLLDVVLTDEDAASRREEILQAISQVNFGARPQRFMGRVLEEK